MSRNHTPDIAELLLDVSDGLEVGGTVEGISTHEEKLDQVPCYVSSGDIQSASEVRECEPVVNGDDVSHTITRIDDNASR
jgi:hypothetical protein